MPSAYAAAMEYYDQWKVGASYIARSTLNAYTEMVAADPQKYQFTVESFDKNLREIRAALTTMRARLRRSDLTPVDASLRVRIIELSQEYQNLATDFYRDTAPVAAPSTGLAFMPIMVLGGVLAVGLGAASIGVAMNTYAMSLREQTMLAREELKARYTLALENKELPPSTVPASGSPMSDAWSAAVSNALYLGVLGGVGVMAWKYFGSQNMR